MLFRSPAARGIRLMRLHRLSLTAFGPFAATETVDFDALAEIIQAQWWTMCGVRGSGGGGCASTSRSKPFLSSNRPLVTPRWNGPLRE